MHKKILVVDDDGLVQYGLKKALKTEGVLVSTANTASEAVLKFASCPYDLCLLDIRLPDFSGMVLVEIIKDICPDVKLIVMTTSYIDDQNLGRHIREAIGSGACHFITKPFELCELKDVVVQALHTNDGFHTGFRFNQDRFFRRKARKRKRKSFSEELLYSLSVIENGEDSRRLLSARAIDVSEHGVGFFTEYPLRPSQVLSFENGILSRTGVVVWSSMLDERTCRVGVNFA